MNCAVRSGGEHGYKLAERDVPDEYASPWNWMHIHVMLLRLSLDSVWGTALGARSVRNKLHDALDSS